jgi:DNA-binding response OmpR family regulator
VLLIEDDPAVREGLQLALSHLGHDVVAASDGESGLVAASSQDPDVVVLDLMLPGIDGFEVCRRLRGTGSIPIIMLTARSDDFDVVAGLEAGADDYLVKPVAIKELTARLRALRRRTRPTGQAAPTLSFGDLQIRPLAGEVTRNGARIALTRTEFRLLCELAQHAGLVLSRQQLLERVWEYEYGDERLVDVHVGRLRAKIEDEPGNPRHLVTVRGLGYKLQR